MWRIFPASCICFMAPRDSSTGVLGVDAVQLPEIDALQLEQAEAHFYLLLEILRAPDGEPLAGTLPGKATLGGD